ncbi:hypothetical protein [Gordonia desulfuricans]|uniref:hypothetical protein n=1 Tax=Gordonia desulfuricans TaxID=89051 RepID=UPI0009F8E7DD|nr:hypothetical protein [Gordonia desulfuricans]
MKFLESAGVGRTVATIAATVALATVAGCSSTADEPAPIAQSTAPTPVAAASSSLRLDDQPVTPAAAKLANGFRRQGFGPGVGVVLVPVGGSATIALGSQTPARVAWSTIKVPLAIAAQRNAADDDAEIGELVESAIINSDNSAALRLRKSLGSPTEARKKVTAVLRDGGDDTTEVVTITQPDETFGLTVWPLTGSAQFTAGLPCLADSAQVVRYMGQVAGVQQWGVEVMRGPKSTAVKGGWGPSDDGGEEVRQIGLITHADGQRTAVAMSSYVTGQTMGEGTATLDRVARWLNQNLALLPRGRC